MALIPDEERDQYRFLAIVVMAGLGVLYWMYVYAPRQEDLVAREERLAQVETRNRTAEARSTNLDRLRSDLERYERQLEALRELVPGESEVARLYETIATESQTLGLELVQVTPSQAQRDTSGYYMRQSWQMQVEGSYHDVGRFLTRVASLDRIVRPSVRSIETSGGSGSGQGGGTSSPVVTVEVELETFVLPPDTTSGGSGSGGEAAGE